MSNYLVDSSDLTSVANAIRTTGGTSASLAFPDGFISAIQALGGGGSSGITEYETGTYTPTSDIARPTINFSNTHTNPPSIIVLADSNQTLSAAANANLYFTYIDHERLFGHGWPYSTNARRYGAALYCYKSSNGISNSQSTFSYSSTNTGDSSSSYPRYFATPTGFKPYSGSTSRYWKSGRAYKWIAIWYTM